MSLVVYFVHILTSGKDKLSAKATKCVFLGYSRLHKGYRCYSPNINRYFISTDVTFFEDSSFFSFATRPPVSDVLSIPLILPSLDFPSPTDAVTRPLQVYTPNINHCYSPDINRYFIPADVTFFEDSSFFTSVRHPPVSDVISIPLVLPSPNFPSPATDVVTRQLQVYTRRPRPLTRPLVQSSSMPPSSPAPIPQPYDDLPIAIQKSTRSTSNPHLVYNFLSFHRLSLPYFVFVSTLSSVSTPNNTSEALSHSG